MVGAVLALAAAALLIAGAVGPVTARFSGSTNTTGSLLRTAVVDLEIRGDGSGATGSLAIDAENLVPGDVVTRCLTVVYHGSASDVDVRLLGRSDGGSGLEAYLRAVVETGTGTDPACADFTTQARLWDGLLGSLWAQHASFATGVAVAEDLDDGDAAALRVTLELVDDDRAQGRDTAFWLVLEARP